MGHRCAKPGPKHHEQPYHGKMSLQRSTRHTAYKPLRRPKTAHSACFRAILAHDAPAAHPGPPQQLFAKTAAVYTNRQTAYPFCILGNNTRRASRRTFLVRWTPVDSLPAPNSEPLPQLPAPAALVSCSRNHAKGDHEPLACLPLRLHRFPLRYHLVDVAHWHDLPPMPRSGCYRLTQGHQRGPLTVLPPVISTAGQRLSQAHRHPLRCHRSPPGRAAQYRHFSAKRADCRSHRGNFRTR
jgi:hypothetical protein